MPKLTPVLIILMPFAGLADWNLDQGIDPLTDEEIFVARTEYRDGIQMRSVTVRCAGGEFSVYFDFDEFLDNDPVVIRYRVDKAELRQDRWVPSARGTAVFAGKPENLAYQLAHGSQFIIEVEDFRGVRDRSTFGLQGSSAAILPVMTACGVDDVPPLTEPSPIVVIPSGTGMWAVQVGVFGGREDAERLAVVLRKQGFAAFLSQLSTGSGPLHRVRIGPQKDREGAEAMAERLNKSGHKGQVVPHP